MPEDNPIARPFTSFNFSVELTLPGEQKPVCSALFSECDGLEVTMQPKTYQEGGNNAAQIHLVGPLSYGQLSLKRGMTDSFDLWDWFDKVTTPGSYSLRADGLVVMLSSDRTTERVRFRLVRCLPVKIKAPALQAKDGTVAIEEMQIAYERLERMSNQA